MTLTSIRRRRIATAPHDRAFAMVLVFCATNAHAAHAQQPRVVTLDSVLTAAANQYPLLDAARARVAAARGARRTAGALPNPVFTYWIESAAFPFQSSRPELQLETQTYATLPLEFLYQRRSALRSADANIDAAAADYSRARQAVALDAARAFYGVAQAQVAVDAASDVRDRLGELVTYNAARVKEGKTAEADLIRAQVELDRVEATLTLAGMELIHARARLSPFLGGDVGASDTIRVTVDDLPAAVAGAAATPVLSLDVLLTTARVARPDLAAARARVVAAEADANYQRALTIRAVGATFGSKRTAGVTSMIAGLTLPLPLFDRNRGAVQQTTALQRAAEAELALADARVAADVRAALTTARALSTQITRLQPTMLARAEESSRIALAAYQEGALSLLQVLDATRSLAEARQTWYRLLFAERESRLALRAAIGDPTLGAVTTPESGRRRDDARSPTPFSMGAPRATGDRP